MLSVADGGSGIQIPQAAKWQLIGNQIKAAFIFARADFVNVVHPAHFVGLHGNRFTSIASRIKANSGWLYQRYGTSNSETRATIPTASSVRFMSAHGFNHKALCAVKRLDCRCGVRRLGEPFSMQMRIFFGNSAVIEKQINDWLQKEKIESIHHVTHTNDQRVMYVTVWWSV